MYIKYCHKYPTYIASSRQSLSSSGASRSAHPLRASSAGWRYRWPSSHSTNSSTTGSLRCSYLNSRTTTTFISATRSCSRSRCPSSSTPSSSASSSSRRSVTARTKRSLSGCRNTKHASPCSSSLVSSGLMFCALSSRAALSAGPYSNALCRCAAQGDSRLLGWLQTYCMTCRSSWCPSCSSAIEVHNKIFPPYSL